jgi:hypothetical protein
MDQIYLKNETRRNSRKIKEKGLSDMLPKNRKKKAQQQQGKNILIYSSRFFTTHNTYREYEEKEKNIKFFLPITTPYFAHFKCE